MRKLLLNLTSGEPLTLMKKLPCFDDLIKFDSLLASVLCLGNHDLINCRLFDVGRIEFCRGQLLGCIRSVQLEEPKEPKEGGASFSLTDVGEGNTIPFHC
jgi:hypothetical protein